MTGVDLIASRIRQSLGESFSLTPTRSLAGLVEFFMLPEGTLRRVEGLDEARAVPGVVDVRFFIKPGDRVVPAVNATQRPGFLLAVGEDPDALMRVSREVKARVRYEVEA